MIIDARCRPMYDEFLRQVQNPTGVTARMGMTPPPSVVEKSESLMLKEMEDSGISMGIAPGRNGHFRYNVSNDCVVDMVKHFKGKFIGIAGINPSDREQAIKDIDTYVVNGPLKGVNIEPGSMSTPWYANDRRIYPIYEKCSEHKIPVMLMIGGRAGPDTSYSDPKIITNIARDFPNVNFYVSHGGWPWAQVLLGACFWQTNIFLGPDMYLLTGVGTADYVAAAKGFMQDRLLFGSAYPLMPFKPCVDKFMELFGDSEVLDKLLYKNAARLFNIDLDSVPA